MKKFVILLAILVTITTQGFSNPNIANQKSDNKNVKTSTLKSAKTKPTSTQNQKITPKNNTLKKGINDFEIVPTMESESSAKNQVWAGAFQIVWNDLMDELIKGPVKFINDQPTMVNLLNKQEFKTTDISESAYYKKWGIASSALKKEIEDGIWEKFKEKSQILDMADWNPGPCKYILYTMMKKDLEYEKEFESLQAAKFDGSKTLIKYFGIEEEPYGTNVKRTVGVLFYNDAKDFAVTLRSKQGDLIHLYRVNTDKTLAEIYKEMKEKTKNNYDRMRSIDKFKAPKINFNQIKEFKELYGKPMFTPKEICNYPIEITKAIERIQFKMDEVGAKVVAEALMELGETSRGRNFKRPEPRHFYFTGPYAIFIEEPGKEPYFAAYIKDPGNIQ